MAAILDLLTAAMSRMPKSGRPDADVSAAQSVADAGWVVDLVILERVDMLAALWDRALASVFEVRHVGAARCEASEHRRVCLGASEPVGEIPVVVI